MSYNIGSTPVVDHEVKVFDRDLCPQIIVGGSSLMNIPYTPYPLNGPPESFHSISSPPCHPPPLFITVHHIQHTLSPHLPFHRYNVFYGYHIRMLKELKFLVETRVHKRLNISYFLMQSLIGSSNKVKEGIPNNWLTTGWSGSSLSIASKTSRSL